MQGIRHLRTHTGRSSSTSNVEPQASTGLPATTLILRTSTEQTGQRRRKAGMH
jgi:hypothetical protein